MSDLIINKTPILHFGARQFEAFSPGEKTAKLALRLFGYIGIPALIVAGGHFMHFYSFDVGLGASGMYIFLSQAIRTGLNRAQNSNQKWMRQALQKELFDPFLKGNATGLSMEAAWLVLDTPRTMEALDGVNALCRTEASTFEDNETFMAHLGRKELESMRLGFVNGVGNQAHHFAGKLLEISHLFGGVNVHGVYNATHGLKRDIEEVRLGRAGIETEPVWHLRAQWDEYFRDNPNGTFVQICHSQGALHTLNALKEYKHAQKIIVISVAGVASIPQGLCKRVIEIRNPLDPVEWYAGKKADAKLVKSREVHLFSDPGYFNEIRSAVCEIWGELQDAPPAKTG